MANFPFKINVSLKDGTQYSHYTSSFATSGETLISASAMVTKINAIPQVSPYIESDSAEGLSEVTSKNFGNRGSGWISASVSHPNTGSITFTDTESTVAGGLNYYTFYGSKVCSVLGIAEGVPIYTENFKFSDDEDDTTNYISGDIISDTLTVKDGFKMSSQARVKGDIIFDEVFGEGQVLFASASVVQSSLGFNGVRSGLNTNHVTASKVYSGNIFTTNIYPSHPTMLSRGFRIHYDTTGNDRIAMRDGESIFWFGRTEQTRVLSTKFTVDNYANILGGVHVGGSTDPGDDNLIVDGNITGSGDVRVEGELVLVNPLEISTNISCSNDIRAAGPSGLKMGEAAYSTDDGYVGLKTNQMGGVNDYMIISPKSGTGHTFISAKDGGGSYIRGGGNNATNQIAVHDADVNDYISVTSTTTRFSGDIAIKGETAMPKFFARRTTDVANISSNTWTTIVHNGEIFDVGSDYNNTNGIFTAPVTGYYHFSWQIRFNNIPSGAEYIWTALQTTDDQILAGLTRTDDLLLGQDPVPVINYWQKGGSVTCLLAAGDTAKSQVYVRADSTVDIDGSSSNFQTWFSGHLTV